MVLPGGMRETNKKTSPSVDIKCLGPSSQRGHIKRGACCDLIADTKDHSTSRAGDDNRIQFILLNKKYSHSHSHNRRNKH